MRVFSPDACGATRRHQRIHACAECRGARVQINDVTVPNSGIKVNNQEQEHIVTTTFQPHALPTNFPGYDHAILFYTTARTEYIAISNFANRLHGHRMQFCCYAARNHEIHLY